MSTKPAFRNITEPLTVTDTDLDRLNQRMGVPTLVAGAPKQEEPPIAPRQQRPINILVPDYVAEAVREKAHKAKSSVRYIVLKALADSGIPVELDDLVLDARRAKA
ncbi:MAG: hypothetical protein JNM89_05810 [Hyphomicrobiaceae bacterium]|nr:hypothetical protein [Hyphomicrobiaceae bacterium]